MINKRFVDKIPRWGVMAALSFSGVPAGAQRVGTGAEAYFQGTCAYRVTVQSKVDDLSDQDIHKVLTVGDHLTVTMKDGNYRLSTEYADTYILKEDRKEYIKF